MQKYPSLFWFISAWVLQNIAWFPGRLMLHFFVHLKVEGTEHIREAAKRSRKEKKGILFAINHTNELDPIVLLAGIRPFSGPYPIIYTARPGNHYKNNHFAGWRGMLFSSDVFMHLWGAFPIIPGSKDYSVSLPIFVDILSRGHSVALFPEGKITRDEFRGEARGGVAYLAEQTNCLIVPVFIDGLWKLRKTGDFWKRKRKARVVYGPVFTENEIPQSEGENMYRDKAEFIMDHVYNLKKE